MEPRYTHDHHPAYMTKAGAAKAAAAVATMRKTSSIEREDFFRF
jgi:hypothetical protein